MSMYNMIFGRNPAAEALLAMLHLTPSEVGRFRDCYPNEDGSKIIVYTRNGGGNREEHQPVLDALSKHPNWIRDYDDDFDSTYASIEFSVPEEFKKVVAAIADHSDTRPPAKKWKTFLDDLETGKDTAQIARAKEVGEKIFAALTESKPGTTEVKTTEGSVQIIRPE